MSIFEDIKKVLEEDNKLHPSDGSKIGYAIDHFGLTIEDILECSEHAELSPVGVVEFLISAEASGKDVMAATKLLKDYVVEQKELSEQERKEEYLKNSSFAHIEEFQNKIKESENKEIIHSGFKTLDKVLDGGLYEGLYLVGAIPSLGKTTMIMQMADNVAKQGRDVLIFSLEMSRFELMAKSVSRCTVYEMKNAGATNMDLKTARDITVGSRYKQYSHTERKLISLAINRFGTFSKHLYVVEGMGDIGAKDIGNKIQEHIDMTGNVPIVVIDYLQILEPWDVRASDKQNTDKTVKELWKISREFETVVIAISSFNRATYNSKVSFGAFKESGSLEYGADVAIGLQLEGAGDADFDSTEAKNRNPRRVEAVILKNRGGRTGDTLCFEYFPQYNLFKDKGLKGESFV